MALMQHDTVDELRLKIFPVALGAGARLFGQASDPRPVRLAGVQTLQGDVAVLTCQRVRDAKSPVRQPSTGQEAPGL